VSFTAPPGTRLVTALGAGSLFEVAVVEQAAQRCLCKRLRSSLSDDLLAARALEREAELLGRVDPTHGSAAVVPRLLDAGRDERGPYLIESFLEGVSLRAIVEGHREGGENLSPELLSGLMRVGFAALADLHALALGDGLLDVVHGDLGPDHLLFAPGRRGAFFVDFGLSRFRGMALAPAPEARGTLPYVAPEVLRGEVPADQAGDVFALAASFAFAALGRDPCREAAVAARLVEIAEHGIDLAMVSESRALEPAAARALAGALAFDRRARLCTAGAVLAVLGA
jgi:serine/threonine protein kinase